MKNIRMILNPELSLKDYPKIILGIKLGNVFSELSGGYETPDKEREELVKQKFLAMEKLQAHFFKHGLASTKHCEDISDSGKFIHSMIIGFEINRYNFEYIESLDLNTLKYHIAGLISISLKDKEIGRHVPPIEEKDINHKMCFYRVGYMMKPYAIEEEL